MSIKVAIVEDETKIRESLAVVIGGTGNFQVTGAYPNAEVALKQIPRDWPQVIVMDINLPEMSGIELVSKLKALKSDLQVLMLTAYEDNELIFNSLMAGASGYLLKRTPPSEILEALMDLSKGGSPMTSSIARKVVQFFQQRKPDSDAEKLTEREREVLSYLAKGFQYKEIAEAMSISSFTVRSHLRNIYEKLHVRTRTEAVVKFMGKGLQI